MSFPEPAWTVPVKQEPEDLLATGTVSVKPEPEDTGTVSIKPEPEDTGTVSIKPEPEDTGTVSIKPEPEDTGTVSIKPEPEDTGTVSVKPEPADETVSVKPEDVPGTDALHVCKEEVSPQQQERSPGLVQTESSVTEDSDEWMETREDPESEASDEEEEMEIESSDAEDEAVGPTDPPEWRDKRSWNPKDIPFSGDPGPRGSAAALQSDNPVDYAELFLCDELLQHIVDHTNLYFSNDWRPLTLVELKNFLGLMFLTGLVWKPSLKDYWTQEEATSTPYFSRTMARDRYQLIWSSLHFNDNPQIDASDQLHKVRPVLDLLLAKFKEMYQPAENVSIDEGMLFWSGRLGFRVYNPAKELLLGLKSYILTESATGYCYAMKPYIGPNCHLQDTVESLIDGLKGYGYRLWMDNFYTSVEMCRLLLGHQMHCCGTLRVHRGEPPAIRDVSVSDLAVGETVSRHNGDVMVLAWRDKRIVRMITTLHKDEMKRVEVKQKGHSGRVPQHKPVCVLAYNLYMNGADRLDQKIAYFPWIGKNEKWSFKFVAYMFQIALANAFIVYRAKNRGGRPKTLKRFILALVKSWTRLRPAGVDEANGPNPPDAPPVPEPPVPPSNRDPEERLDVNFAGHVMVPVQPAGKQTKPLRMCKHCSNQNIQKETQYVCTGCDNVALCVYPCFFQYHSR